MLLLLPYVINKITIDPYRRLTIPHQQKSNCSAHIEEMCHTLAKELEDIKAEDIVIICLSEKSDFADYMIIASGRSQRQVNAAAERIRKLIKKKTGEIPALEGQPRCDWVLIDANEIVIHIFQPQVREFYNLEKMWSANLTPESENESTETIL